ncbi:hypothetical protein BC30102_p803 (plasmid) [Bacillus cereus]|nr:hypothetical protein BC30102_p803 [Bacillus cereus]
MFQEEHEEQHEIEELQTYSIEESIQMKREQSKERNKQYEEKLKVLKEKVDKLKKENTLSWEKNGHGRNAGTITFILNDGIQEGPQTIIEEDHNVYLFGKVVN